MYQNSGFNSTKKRPFKKKGFLIDKITELTFSENLLLGLTTVLKSCQFVSQIKLDKYLPATLEEVQQWEYSNSTRLPEDLKNFYLSTNGFSFTYKFQYDRDDQEDVGYVVGAIEINSLSKLERATTTESWYMTEMGSKMMVPQCKIFILKELEDNNCVVLANCQPKKPLSIWLYYKMRNLFFICEDFTTYFRMALAHLGAPGWQLGVLKANLPEWSVELFQILAPALLEGRLIFENHIENNVIDSRIFVCDEGDDDKSQVNEKSSKKSKSAKKK